MNSSWTQFSARIQQLAQTNAGLYLLLFVLSLSFSFSYLIAHDFPVPKVHDEFSYLLAGETFAQGRLSNPTPPMWKHFETFHVLVKPSYMSKYPPAQGLVLALGFWLGHPIFGVYVSVAFMSASFAWLLCGYIKNKLFVLAALLPVLFYLSFNHYWSQSYWGGAVPAIGGALVFGALPRVTQRQSNSAGWLCGLGTALLFLSRPFEGFVVCLVPAGFFLYWWHQHGLYSAVVWKRLVLPCALILAAAVAFSLFHNAQVTGSSLLFPHEIYTDQYLNTPHFFGVSPDQAPQLTNPRLQQFYDAYLSQLIRRDWKPAQLLTERTAEVVFCVLSVYMGGLVLLSFVQRPNKWIKTAWGILGLMTIAMIVIRPFHAHYGAPAAGVLVYVAVFSVYRLLTRSSPHVNAKPYQIFIVLVCLLAYIGVSVKENGYYIGHMLIERRQGIARELQKKAGKDLVIVSYKPDASVHQEWVYNHANIDDSEIVWAHDLGPKKNREIINYYDDRNVWMVKVGLNSVELFRIPTDQQQHNEAVKS